MSQAGSSLGRNEASTAVVALYVPTPRGKGAGASLLDSVLHFEFTEPSGESCKTATTLAERDRTRIPSISNVTIRRSSKHVSMFHVTTFDQSFHTSVYANVMTP